MRSPPERQDEWLNEPCQTCSDALAPEHWMNVYQACKEGLDIENNLVNFRVSWAIALTAAFLTAESFVFGRMLDLSVPATYNLVNYAIGLVAAALSGIAAWFCWRTQSGVRAALNQIDYLKNWLVRSRPQFDRMCLPAPYGDNRGYRVGHGTDAMFPIVMFVMWVLIGGAQIVWVTSASLSHDDVSRATFALSWALAIVGVGTWLELRARGGAPGETSPHTDSFAAFAHPHALSGAGASSPLA